MKQRPRDGRGRPKTSKLTRAEQLRAAKRTQRVKEKRAGLAAVELRLPREDAARLRAAARASTFERSLDQFLGEIVLDLDRWPVLRSLAWNRAGRWIPAEDALALYERNWRFVEPDRLTAAEAALIERLKNRFGGGVVNG
jgi:hypothetical protein